MDMVGAVAAHDSMVALDAVLGMARAEEAVTEVVASSKKAVSRGVVKEGDAVSNVAILRVVEMASKGEVV